jgi:hypothetical protein
LVSLSFNFIERHNKRYCLKISLMPLTVAIYELNVSYFRQSFSILNIH